MIYAMAALTGLVGRLLRREVPLNVRGVWLLHSMPPADHGKATRELGWQPRPTSESIRKAAQFYVDQRGRETAKSRMLG